MIRPSIITEGPVIIGKIQSISPKIKGVIQRDAPVIVGRILKSIEREPEPYFEVANDYGITIYIGE